MKDLSIYDPSEPIDSSLGFESYNNVQRAVDLLPEQFKEKPQINALIETFAAGVQEAENLITDILHNTELSAAVGEQLNVLGRLFGEARNGRDDVEYRKALQTRVAINTSDGTPNELLSLAALLAGSPNVRYFEHYPADYAMMMEVSPAGSGLPNDILDFPADAANLLKAASPAGVGVVMAMIHYADNSVLGEFQTIADNLQVLDDGIAYFLVDHLGNAMQYQAKGVVEDYASLGILSETIPQDGELVSAGGVDLWQTTDSDQLVLIFNNEISLEGSGIFSEVLLNE